MSTLQRIELDSLASFQNELYPKEGKTKSHFFEEVKVVTWYFHMPHLLRPIPGGDGEITFEASNAFHRLLYTYMRQQLPAIKVVDKFKEKIRICWPTNIGTNIIQNAQLFHNEEQLNSFDNVWLDIKPQFFMKPGFHSNYQERVGNLPFLEQWNTCLPSYTTNINQPWYYEKSTAYSFPLFLSDTHTTLTHVYRLRNKVSELLRMQEFKDGVWTDIECDFKYLNGVDSKSVLKAPQLWGRYAYITPDEIAWWRCQESVVHYIDDVVALDSSNTDTFGQNVTIPLNTEFPVKAVFWVAENVKSTENRNYSNYTTNEHDLYRGWDPIGKSTMKHNTTVRFQKMDSDHFNMSEPERHFVSAPYHPGYHGYSFAQRADSTNIDITLVFKSLKTQLEVTLKDTDPFLIPLEHPSFGRDDGPEEKSETKSVSGSGTSKRDDLDLISLRSSSRDGSKKELPKTSSSSSIKSKPPKLSTPQFRVLLRVLALRKLTIERDPNAKDSKTAGYTFTIS